MAGSVAERVALEITRYWSGDSADYEVALRYIQAAIDEAVEQERIAFAELMRKHVGAPTSKP